MSKKTRTILLIILLLVVAVIASRSLWQGQGTAGKTAVSGEYGSNAVDNSKATPPQQLNQKPVPGSALSDIVNAAIGKGKSAVLVFTYDADCCPSTKEYFEKHRTAVKGLEQKYSAKVNFVWIDVARYGETEKDSLVSIAKKYGVSAIPALVLIDAKGEPLPAVLGEINEKTIAGKLEGLVKGQ